jgi:hypothetical protein
VTGVTASPALTSGNFNSAGTDAATLTPSTAGNGTVSATFDEQTVSLNFISATPATMTSPKSGSTLGASDVQFTWTTGAGVTEYQLWLGTSGPGSSSLYVSGWLTTTSTTVTSLPAKGATVYARLYSMIGGKNQYIDYTYTEQ